jgi:hypothetical protein
MRRKGKIPPLQDCLNGKPETIVLNYQHEQGKIYSGEYRGLVLRDKQEFFVVETCNRLYLLQNCGSLEYNRKKLTRGDEIKVVFEGFNIKAKCYSFAVLKCRNERWFVVATGMEVKGDWEVSRKGVYDSLR